MPERNERIAMLETEQSLERLNQVLIEREISISDVISVVEHPGGAMAIGEHNQAKYRVYYRA